MSYLNLTRQLALTLADRPDRARTLTLENLERARRLRERHPPSSMAALASVSQALSACRP